MIFFARGARPARLQRQWAAFSALVFLIAGGYYFTLSAPLDFPSESLVVIARGAPAGEVAQELFDAHVIRQPFLLRLLLHITGESNGVQAGVYRFAVSQNLFIVARRLVTGDYGLPSVRVTFIEGDTVRDMAGRVAEAFPNIPASAFLAAEGPHEGYLFPDTYFFSPSATADSIVAAMLKNFNAKTAPLSPDVSASGHSLSDIVTMASLVEKEARTSANRRIVAGILWSRLARKMPLQVDAVFGYIYGRDTYSPSLTDLSVNSPYNTYTRTGLPPGPIDNPGLDSLQAVLHPTQTEYVYYLTDKDGVMHYATTYAAHQTNQEKYLR